MQQLVVARPRFMRFLPLGVLVIVSALLQMSMSTLAPGVAATSAFGVYLEPPDTPADLRLNVDLVARTVEDEVIVVPTVAELQATVAALSPQSIWINQAALDMVPQDWLREQMRRSTVIVGINTTTGELASVLGVSPGGSADYRPEGRSMFAMYAQRVDVPYTNADGEPATMSIKGWFNNPYDPRRPESLFVFVREAIENTQLSRPEPPPNMTTASPTQ